VKPLDEVTIVPGRSIRAAMAVIDRGAVGIALLIDQRGALLGTVSDGDVRRALLGGASLDDPVDPFANPEPVCVPAGTGRAEVLDLMRACRLEQVPVVEGDRLVGLHVMQDVLGAAAKPNPAVVLAGGRGTRLGALAASTPKPMLPVAGRPILERIVLHLVGSGIGTIYLAVNHLAEQIERHFRDGSDYGVTIRYLHEDPSSPLGTGGPLRSLLELEEPPTDPLVVLNGDLVTSFSMTGLLAAHTQARAVMTVAVHEYGHEVPFGVVELDADDHRLLRRIEEKPRWSGLVNAGIYVIEPPLLDSIPPGIEYPITELIAACLQRGERVAGWPLVGEWHDIGRPQELSRARGEL
jgi:dTDP-glucose pyrophosphorylase